ncbi:MAG: ATP-binding cassette domain-containing protein [Zetaproteobacteria bacterium]|nr:MAG: ATP-binding cassette domain-containing protein [Zetaproteobacteria bacterium]
MAYDLDAKNIILAYPMSAGILTVLDIEELRVPAGAAVGITGSSGSGKTSLLAVLAGLERPQYGTIRWSYTDIRALAEAERDRWRRTHVGMVFRDFHLFPGMTALQNVLVAASFDRLFPPFSMKDRARALLTRVDLRGGRQRVETLSRGEMQRVAVARGLLCNPRIVLADEPTANLDRVNGERVTDLLLDLCRESGATLLVASQDAAVLRRLDAVHTLVGGRLVEALEPAVRSC